MAGEANHAIPEKQMIFRFCATTGLVPFVLLVFIFSWMAGGEIFRSWETRKEVGTAQKDLGGGRGLFWIRKGQRTMRV